MKNILVVARGVLLAFLVCVVVSCGGVGGIVSSVTGGSTSGATDTSSDSAAGNGELFSDAPVDIPVTIAKATEGVDATTVQFIGGNPSLSAPQLTRNRESSVAVGTIEFTLRDISTDRLVGLIYGGELQSTTTTVAGSGSFSVPSFDVPMALVVAAEGTTDDTGDWSPPIVVTAHEDDGGLVDAGDFIVVNITNTAGAASGAMGAADIGLFLAMGEDDVVTFVGTESGSTPFVGKIEVEGGVDYDVFSTEPANELIEISYDNDGILTGVDSETAQITRIDDNGDVNYLEDDSALLGDASRRRYSITPDNQWMAVSRRQSVGSATHTLTLIDLDNPNTEITPTITGLAEPATERTLNFTWLDNDRLFGFSFSQPFGQVLDLADVLIGNSNSVTPENMFNDDGQTPMYNADRNELVYVCIRDGSSNPPLTDLCLYDLDTSQISTLVSFDDPDFNVVLPKLSPTGQYVAFEVDTDPDVDTINPLGIYVFATDEITYLGKGGSPTPAPTNPNIIAYFTCDTDGDQDCDSNDAGGSQIGVFNLENFNVDLD